MTTTEGRGAWPQSGAGGTLSQDGTEPGPYYTVGRGMATPGSEGHHSEFLDERAVWHAVVAIQRRLRFLVDPHLRITGRFTPDTRAAVMAFQEQHPRLTPWGGVGPETAKLLFRHRLSYICRHDREVCGFVTMESAWDPGAVGRVDNADLGFSQINGRAHPDMSEDERFNPTLAFEFTDEYLTSALRQLGGNMTDAIVSYNLGVGGRNSSGVLVGTRAWIADGRPDIWTPPGQEDARNIKAYYTNVQTACDRITPDKAIPMASANIKEKP